MTTLRRFADEEMDVAALCMCPREDLVELGLDKKGQQLKLDKEIAKHLDLAHQTRIMDSDKLFRLLSMPTKNARQSQTTVSTAYGQASQARVQSSARAATQTSLQLRDGECVIPANRNLQRICTDLDVQRTWLAQQKARQTRRSIVDAWSQHSDCAGKNRWIRHSLPQPPRIPDFPIPTRCAVPPSPDPIS